MQEHEVEKLIQQVTKEISDMLIAKNRSYGNSALNPVRIFSKADKLEQLKVRIDDKLSRIANNKQDAWLKEDCILDLLGYLVLFRIATLEEAEVAEPFEEKLPIVPAEKLKLDVIKRAREIFNAEKIDWESALDQAASESNLDNPSENPKSKLDHEADF